MVTTDRPSVTYLDFLELLLANLPDEKYRADSGGWSMAIYRLRAKYEEEYPELFEDFVLIARPPMDPHSEEVSDFLRVEQQADIIHIHNPGFVLLEIPEPNKTVLRERNAVLETRYKKQIEAMVKEILPFVSLPPPSAGRPTRRLTQSDK